MMKADSIQEIPSGLLRKIPDSNAAMENVELRAVLDKAADEANLNVTERMALNKKFFPDGGGFDLFQKGEKVQNFNLYIGCGYADEFAREAEQMKMPEDVCRQKVSYYKSSKDSYKANLDNALKKLKNVLKGRID